MTETIPTPIDGAEPGPQPNPKPKRRPQDRDVRGTRRTGQLSGIQIMFAVILAVGLILAINFSSRIAGSQPLLETYNSVRDEVGTLEAQQAQLSEERDFARSDAYVESWARDRGKMVKPGERLIIPVPAGIAPEPTAVPSVNIEFQSGLPEPEPWEYWWQLFFDSPPPDIDLP